MLAVRKPSKKSWVRVVGLPLHYWSGEMFKRIGECCGGFVEVDEETKIKFSFNGPEFW